MTTPPSKATAMMDVPIECSPPHSDGGGSIADFVDHPLRTSSTRNKRAALGTVP
jgi:hypothetical protein